MALFVPFPGQVAASLEDLGGKGYSLVRMTEMGLPVPAGGVLTTAFFEPWLATIRDSDPWQELSEDEPELWQELCDAAKGLCAELELVEIQETALADLRSHFEGLSRGSLPASPPPGGLVKGPQFLAVRSSSPDEDLDSASFAGGYETRLGVRLDDLEGALRHCFASCFDARVLVYKRQHGFDIRRPRIAVVVQAQIDSEVSGVGFSLDPLSNDYDHAVFDANWGLGESVVSGSVTPDHFVVDKVDGSLLESTLGARHISLWLASDGGTLERQGYRQSEPCLDGGQLAELTELLCRVEALYDKPVDIEWTFAAGRLHVLQARPITAYVPLPDEMRTAPGEPRRAYADLALSSGFTLNAPISPMGLAWMEENIHSMMELFLGKVDGELPFEEKLWFFAGSRMYQNLSNVFWLASARRMARASEDSDPLMAEILAHLDEELYRTPKRPSWAGLGLVKYLPRLLGSMFRFAGRALRMALTPDRAYREYTKETAAFEARMRSSLQSPESDGISFDAFRRLQSEAAMPFLFAVQMPALAVGLGALAGVRRLAGGKRNPEVRERVNALTVGFTGNVVVQMGIELFHLAKLLEPADLDDPAALESQLKQRQLSPEALDAWDSFASRFGWRGPLEMDLASPRYADSPRLAFRQMASMSSEDSRFDPEVTHLRVVEERRQAFRELIEQSGPVRRWLLRRLHHLLELFAGVRDTPKHHNLLMHAAVRRRALEEGEALVRQGRLDRAEQVFDLTFDDLRQAAEDPELDLRRSSRERTRFQRLLAAKVSRFPSVIDSRGRILRPPPRQEGPGELRGIPLSPGVTEGPVKVLQNPQEKPVLEGDVLVAYTTDPGWTPLFANAAAVVLEIGGVLQHGAVVAREYGKPCVSGIDRVMSRLEDGQWVEVDGSTGIVRLLERPEDKAD